MLFNSYNRSIIKKIIGPFLFCFISIMFLLFVQFLILHIDKLVGKGLSNEVIIKLILYSLAYMVVTAVPMATLIASIMAYGKMSEYFELHALRASGINIFRLILPSLYFGIVVTLLLFWFGNYILPNTNFEIRKLYKYIIYAKPGFELQSNQFYQGIKDYVILTRTIENGDTLSNIVVWNVNNNNKFSIMRAKAGSLKQLQEGYISFKFYDGSLTTLKKGKTKENKYERLYFDINHLRFDLSKLNLSGATTLNIERGERSMNIESLSSVVKNLENKKLERIKKHKQNIQTKSIFQPLMETQTTSDKTYKSTISDTASVYNVFHELNELNKKRIINTTKNKYNTISNELQQYINTQNRRESEIRRYDVEIHKKYSIPMACVIFALLGAAIGIISRRGNLGFAAIIGTIILTFFWVGLLQGEKLAEQLIYSTFIGIWYPNIILLIIAIIITITITTSLHHKLKHTIYILKRAIT